MKNILYIILVISTFSCSVKFPIGYQLNNNMYYSYQLIKNNEDSLEVKMIYQNFSNDSIKYFQIGFCSPVLKIFEKRTGRLIGDMYFNGDCNSKMVGPNFSDTIIINLYKSPIFKLLSYRTEYTIGFDFNNKNNISFVYMRPNDFLIKKLPVLNNFSIYDNNGIVLNKSYIESNIDTAFFYLRINDPKRGKNLRLKKIIVDFNIFKEIPDTGGNKQKCDVTDIVEIRRINNELFLAIIPKNQVLTKCNYLNISKKSIVSFEMNGYYKVEKITIAMNFAEFIFPELLNN